MTKSLKALVDMTASCRFAVFWLLHILDWLPLLGEIRNWLYSEWPKLLQSDSATIVQNFFNLAC